jgi:hypothetical protein
MNVVPEVDRISGQFERNEKTGLYLHFCYLRFASNDPVFRLK